MRRDETPQMTRGRLVEIGGGRRLRVVVSGPLAPDAPLVFLEAGAFGFSADWSDVQSLLAARGAASLAYDRAGLGFSDPGPAPRDSSAIAADALALLAAMAHRGPLILCGHSMAGLHLRVLAPQVATRVLGIVLVDAAMPEAMDSKILSRFVEPFAGVSKLAAWGAEAGVMKLFAGPLGDAIGLQGEAAVEKRWAFASPTHNHWAAQEAATWAVSSEQGRRAGPFDPQWPVAAIQAGPKGASGGLRDLQSAPARASSRGMTETVAAATHASILSAAHAGAVVRGVEHVFNAVGLNL